MNQLSKADSKSSEKFKVQDSWLWYDWKNKNKQEEGEGVNNSEYFDAWTISSKGGKNEEFDIWKKIERLATYMSICYKASISLIDEGIYNKYFNKTSKKDWSAIWSHVDSDQYKDEKVEWQGWPIKLKEELQNYEKVCKKQELERSQKIYGNWEAFDTWVGAKMKGKKFPKIQNVEFELKQNSQNSVNLKMEMGLISSNDIFPHNGKIRLFYASQGKNYFYIDVWAKKIEPKSIKQFAKEIMNKGKCLIDLEEENERELSREKCQGFLYLKELFKDNKEQKHSNGLREKCWQNHSWSDSCSYEEHIEDGWQYFEQEITTKWLEFGQEIGLVWEGKEFKWRSF
ncbi:hypothetical protein [Mycoplasma parvum]|uniref:Uncharacterized protein n=1 Tax=Mycoplasma parvum str. Indiana TaxID=1403316 RepID=U5NCA2_9MOLU|nr:hypothetical protein [Mycoplasma parvum]AGX88935.1 hypothetical protein PRV_00850 [Mycoplasma parvum str. Indiana]